MPCPLQESRAFFLTMTFMGAGHSPGLLKKQTVFQVEGTQNQAGRKSVVAAALDKSVEPRELLPRPRGRLHQRVKRAHQQADHHGGRHAFSAHVANGDQQAVFPKRRAGMHRNYIDGHKASSDFDRSSFTRFRILGSSGKWNGIEPLVQPGITAQ